jgi:hypothetical protein
MNKELRNYLGMVIISLFTTLTFCACSSEGDDNEAPLKSIVLADGQSATLFANEDNPTGTISFTAPAAWTAQCVDESGNEMTDDNPWIMLTEDSGEAGEGCIRYILSTNYTNTARTGYVVITSADSSQKIQITQAALEATNASNTMITNSVYIYDKPLQVDNLMALDHRNASRELNSSYLIYSNKACIEYSYTENKKSKMIYNLFSNNGNLYILDHSTYIGHAITEQTNKGYILKGGSFDFYNDNKGLDTLTVVYDNNDHVKTLKHKTSAKDSIVYTYTWNGDDLTRVDGDNGSWIRFEYTDIDADLEFLNLNWVFYRDIDMMTQCTGNAYGLWPLIKKLGKGPRYIARKVEAYDGAKSVTCTFQTESEAFGFDMGYSEQYFIDYEETVGGSTTSHLEQWNLRISALSW